MMFGTAGETDALAGLARVLKFQHEVRTPTSHLIFHPNAKLSQIGRTVPYYSKTHAEHAESGTAFKKLTQEQQRQFYPEGGPQPGEPIPAAGMPGEPPRTSKAAVWSLVLSIIPACITQLIALPLAIVALVKIGNSQGRLTGQPLAIPERRMPVWQ